MAYRIPTMMSEIGKATMDAVTDRFAPECQLSAAVIFLDTALLRIEQAIETGDLDHIRDIAARVRKP